MTKNDRPAVPRQSLAERRREFAEVQRNDAERARRVAEEGRTTAEKARRVTEIARDAVLESVAETASSLKETLGQMKVAEDARRLRREH